MDGKFDTLFAVANAARSSLARGQEKRNECAGEESMSEGKAKTWFWAAAGLVAIQLVALFGLMQMRRGGEKGQEWALDPQATVAEAAREKESREALGNLPLPDGSVRLTVSAAQAAAPQADKLLEQARDLQNRGQLDLAEKLLEQARVQSPKNMRVRVAAALLAEARGDSAAAWQRWRELIQESEPGGAVRRLALARSKILEERVRLEQVAKQREESLAKHPRKLALVSVEEKVGEGLRRVDWTVRAIPGGGKLASSKVAVRVLFFERGASGVLQKSEAGMARWLKGPPLQESDGGRVVSCEPKVGAGAKYAGYAWQIYYEGELQDERIQPAYLRGVLREMPRS